MIPVVDIFAGPGGLGEGFAAARDRHRRPAFDVVLSIEKERHAVQTLRLRSFFRQFPAGQAPEDYYRLLRRQISLADLYARHPAEGDRAACRTWHAELGGKGTHSQDVDERIAAAVEGERNWVLVGGS